MKHSNHSQHLQELLAMDCENEVVEFKEAKRNFDLGKLGKYFSALSNEANLAQKPVAWLVFGVADVSRKVVGTRYRESRASLESLKNELASGTTGRITFIAIHEIDHPKGRVLMFGIPTAPRGIPVAWKGHYYGRDGESLVPLNIEEIERIRAQASFDDWSAQLCEGASLEDIDPSALQKARLEFAKKHRHLKGEMDQWGDFTFLKKAKLTVRDGITRAAIVLLGKEESDHFISPSVCRISWVLKDEKGQELDYQHFGPPLLLQTDAVLAKIRNLNYRYLPDQTLFPIEVSQYDPYVIREALHNCIAHQDYKLCGRITVVERPQTLQFTNLGSFIPGSVEAVIQQDAPQEFYRSRLLAEAMVNLNMIDTIGSGIRKMFNVQRKRYFPLPDFELGDPQRVKVTVTGAVIDENYTRMLMENTGLDLETVIALDKVQKGKQPSKEEVSQLRQQNLIEGRVPNLYVAAHVAAVTGDRAAYIRKRAFDDDYYKKLILSYLQRYGSATRKDIDDLLMDKLSDVLSKGQKRTKVKNLLAAMARGDMSIQTIGSTRNAKWIICEKSR